MVNLIKVTNEDLRKMDKLEFYHLLKGNLEDKTPEKDFNEKPFLKLTPIKNTAVHVSTQEESNELMRVYLKGGWKALNGCLPTELNCFRMYGKKTCVDANDGFGYCKGEFYLNENWNIISTKKFYEKQKITQEKLKEINGDFEGGK